MIDEQFQEAMGEVLAGLLAQLRAARLARGGMTQERLAQRIPVGLRTLNQWEAASEHPTLLNLVRWCRELGLRVVLVERDGSVIGLPVGGGAADGWDVEQSAGLLHGLYQVRRQRNIAQAWLAERLGVAQRTLRRWEYARSYPQVLRLVIWANLLGCHVRLVSVGG